MHIEATHKVAMTGESAFPAMPVAAFRFMPMTANGTRARCASFRSSDYRDATQFQLVAQIGYVLAIFPFGHAVIVLRTIVLVPNSIGIADVGLADSVSFAELSNPASSFMPQVFYLAAGLRRDAAFRAHEFLVAARPACAFGKTALDLGYGLLPIPLDGSDPSARNDKTVSRIGGNSRQVDLAQVNRGMNIAGDGGICLKRLLDMQFKTIVPNERHCSGLLNLKVEDKRLSPFPHREYQLAVFYLDRLSGPQHRIEGLGAPRVLDPLVALFTVLSSSVYIGDKRLANHLGGLAMDLCLAFGGGL